MIVPVILSGGVGSRLWPLSSADSPKQFHALVGERSMIQTTAERARRVGADGSPVVVSSGRHLADIRHHLAEVEVRPSLIICEPSGRNTAPAVAAAALTLDPDDLLFVMPADHLIERETALAQALEQAVAAASSGSLVTFGIVPHGPATGYGYIQAAATDAPVREVVRFVEKPDLETAQEYYASGRFLWNSGMFLFTAGAILTELEHHAPDILDPVRRSMADPDGGVMTLGDSFAEAPPLSIDVAIMEKTDRAMVVDLDAGWNDVGSWAALWELDDRDTAGNVTVGNVAARDVRRSYLRSEGPPVAVIGLNDVVVVATPAGVLVSTRDRVQEVKALVEQMKPA